MLFFSSPSLYASCPGAQTPTRHSSHNVSRVRIFQGRAGAAPRQPVPTIGICGKRRVVSLRRGDRRASFFTKRGLKTGVLPAKSSTATYPDLSEKRAPPQMRHASCVSTSANPPKPTPGFTTWFSRCVLGVSSLLPRPCHPSFEVSSFRTSALRSSTERQTSLDFRTGCGPRTTLFSRALPRRPS